MICIGKIHLSMNRNINQDNLFSILVYKVMLCYDVLQNSRTGHRIRFVITYTSRATFFRERYLVLARSLFIKLYYILMWSGLRKHITFIRILFFRQNFLCFQSI